MWYPVRRGCCLSASVDGVRVHIVAQVRLKDVRRGGAASLAQMVVSDADSMKFNDLGDLVQFGSFVTPSSSLHGWSSSGRLFTTEASAISWLLGLLLVQDGRVLASAQHVHSVSRATGLSA